MRIKKIFSLSEEDNSVFKVEFNPFVDDQDFLKTQKISYEILFPQFDVKFLLNLCPNPDFILEPTNDPDLIGYYIVTIEVPIPKAIFLAPFIDTIQLCLVKLPATLFTLLYFDEILQNEKFSLSMYKGQMQNKTWKHFLGLQMSDAYSTIYSSGAVPMAEKLRNLQIIKKKRFFQENHLGRMLMFEDNCRDFTVMAGNSKIPVHKCVLSASSPVLAKMLSSGMDEGRNSIWKITDIPENSVQKAIDFMYSGQIEVNEVDNNFAQILLGLYLFAHKYDMPNLKLSVFEKCQIHIEYFNKNPEEKLQFIHNASFHETQMDDLKTFLAIFGPYPIE